MDNEVIKIMNGGDASIIEASKNKIHQSYNKIGRKHYYLNTWNEIIIMVKI